MVVLVLDLLKIHRKVVFGNVTVVIQNMFREAPKSLDVLNMIFGSFVHQLL